MITLVIPVYNTPEKYLRQCLASVDNQAVPCPVLIINDGSTDPQTLQVLQEYRQKYTVIDKENGGLSDAMNRGITECKTPWLLKLDSDDVAKPLLVKKMLLAAGSEAELEVDVIGCQIRAFGEAQYTTSHSREVTPQSILENKLFWPVNNTGVCMRVSTLKDLGGYALCREGLAEDYELWVNILLNRGQIRNLPEILVHYRVRDNSLRTVNKTYRNVVFLERCREKLKWLL